MLAILVEDFLVDKFEKFEFICKKCFFYKLSWRFQNINNFPVIGLRYTLSISSPHMIHRKPLQMFWPVSHVVRNNYIVLNYLFYLHTFIRFLQFVVDGFPLSRVFTRFNMLFQFIIDNNNNNNNNKNKNKNKNHNYNYVKLSFINYFP